MSLAGSPLERRVRALDSKFDGWGRITETREALGWRIVAFGPGDSSACRVYWHSVRENALLSAVEYCEAQNESIDAAKRVGAQATIEGPFYVPRSALDDEINAHGRTKDTLKALVNDLTKANERLSALSTKAIRAEDEVWALRVLTKKDHEDVKALRCRAEDAEKGCREREAVLALREQEVNEALDLAAQAEEEARLWRLKYVAVSGKAATRLEAIRLLESVAEDEERAVRRTEARRDAFKCGMIGAALAACAAWCFATATQHLLRPEPPPVVQQATYQEGTF